jgi:predicted N-acetyltransferase YhbS
MKIDIRPETKAEQKEIFAMVQRIGGGKAAADLVTRLHRTAEFKGSLSLAARYYEHPVGYIMFHPASITGETAKTETVALVALAVAPAQRDQGIEEKLVKVGLSKAKKLGFTSVVAHGDPAWLGQFGFKPLESWNIAPAPSAHGEKYFALELVPGALGSVSGTLSFPR